MDNLSRLAIHTITTKQWDFPTACQKFATGGVRGMGIWRQWLEGRSLEESKTLLDDHGLEAVSLVRGGFFVSTDPVKRQAALDDNRRCLDEAQAVGAPQVVLVCGAEPGVPLVEARKQITEGIAALIDHAQALGVILAIEPLHPLYADCRSAVNTVGQANDLMDQLNSPLVGVAVDVYHVWWDPDLEQQLQRAGERICGFHVCDWKTPTEDLLNDRGLMGEGCIDIPRIRSWVEATGFQGWNEVEIFSNRWWATDPDTYLSKIKEAYINHV